MTPFATFGQQQNWKVPFTITGFNNPHLVKTDPSVIGPEL